MLNRQIIEKEGVELKLLDHNGKTVNNGFRLSGGALEEKS